LAASKLSAGRKKLSKSINRIEVYFAHLALGDECLQNEVPLDGVIRTSNLSACKTKFRWTESSALAIRAPAKRSSAALWRNVVLRRARTDYVPDNGTPSVKDYLLAGNGNFVAQDSLSEDCFSGSRLEIAFELYRLSLRFHSNVADKSQGSVGFG